MRTITLAAIVAALLIAPTGASAAVDVQASRWQPPTGCGLLTKKECRAKRQAIHRRYSYCNTWACVERADRRAARALERHMRKTIQPYLGWLESVRNCESPSGVDSKPYNARGDRFHGYYQFMLSTWASVGGVGDPHNASWLEQSYRAVILRQRSGTGPWPICG